MRSASAALVRVHGQRGGGEAGGAALGGGGGGGGFRWRWRRREEEEGEEDGVGRGACDQRAQRQRQVLLLMHSALMSCCRCSLPSFPAAESAGSEAGWGRAERSVRARHSSGCAGHRRGGPRPRPWLESMGDASSQGGCQTSPCARSPGGRGGIQAGAQPQRRGRLRARCRERVWRVSA
eukprot:3551301-Rhodomonas_salina.1